MSLPASYSVNCKNGTGKSLYFFAKQLRNITLDLLMRMFESISILYEAEMNCV